MNYSSIEQVIRISTKHNCKVWTMWSSAGEKLDSQLSESMEIGKSMEQLRECFTDTKGDYVTVQVSTKKLGKGGDQQTGVYRYTLRCLENIEEESQGNFTPAKMRVQQFGGEDMYSRLLNIEVKLAEQKKDEKIRDLERQLKEQKEGGKDRRGRLLEKYLEKIFLENEKKTTAATIAGVTGTKQEAAAPAETAASPEERKAAIQKLGKQLQRMQKLDKNFIDNLEKLANFAEKNPDQYQGYITML